MNTSSSGVVGRLLTPSSLQSWCLRPIDDAVDEHLGTDCDLCMEDQTVEADSYAPGQAAGTVQHKLPGSPRPWWNASKGSPGATQGTADAGRRRPHEEVCNSVPGGHALIGPQRHGGDAKQHHCGQYDGRSASKPRCEISDEHHHREGDEHAEGVVRGSVGF